MKDHMTPTLRSSRKRTGAAHVRQTVLTCLVVLVVWAGGAGAGPHEVLLSGDIDLLFGDIPTNDGVTVTFEAKVNPSTPPETRHVSAHGYVAGDNFFSVFTDDPDVGGPTDPTLTGIRIEQDFGDAGDPPYPTLAAADGARHVLRYGYHLGASVDADPDGQPTILATGDDEDTAGDDEDGVALPAVLPDATTIPVTVTASSNGLLSVWIDFDRDGAWESPAEHVLDDHPLAAGVNLLSLTIPALDDGGTSYARFRFSSEGGLGPTGVALDGEVEDYMVDLVARPVLRLVEIPAGVQIRGEAGPGRMHRIEYAERNRILPPPEWKLLGTREVAPDGTFEIDDTTIGTNSARYYRTVLP
jgi:hypothetical protein